MAGAPYGIIDEGTDISRWKISPTDASGNPLGNSSRFLGTLVSGVGGRVNVIDFGAIGDGLSHPLSETYATLRDAQALCPQVTALSQETDWMALQRALNFAADFPAVPGAAIGTAASGTEIWIPAGVTLNPGQNPQPLVINNASLTIRGADEKGSAILVGASGTPLLEFGLDNGMAAQTVSISSKGQGFVVEETMTGTEGTFTRPFVIEVTAINDGGSIASVSITDGGSYTVTPASPLAFTASAQGAGASMTGTFTNGVLTAVAFAGTGITYADGDVLIVVGGTSPSNSVRPCKLTVTNAVGGVIQPGGITITDGGSYGTPPVNPVAVTGGSGSGALFNISNFTNRGGSLTLDRVRFVATVPAAFLVSAQFNLSYRSTLFSKLCFDYTGNNSWGTLAQLHSVTNGLFEAIEALNNLAALNSTSPTGFLMTEQNNLNGHYEHHWRDVSLGGGWNYGWHYKLTDSPGFQGLRFHNCSCGPGNVAWNLENTSARPTGYVECEWIQCFDQTVTFLSINHALGLMLRGCSVGFGQNRLSVQPATADKIYLNNCLQVLLTDNVFATALALITGGSNFVHFDGTSGSAVCRNNILSNAAKVPGLIGYKAASGTGGITQAGDTWLSVTDLLTPVSDAAPAGKNSWSATAVPGQIALFGRNTSFAVPSEQGLIIPGGGNPACAGMSGRRWYARAEASANDTPSTGTLYASPVYVPTPTQLYALGFNIKTASGGNWNARMGLYSDNGQSGQAMGPVTAVFDSGNLAFTSASTGDQTVLVHPATTGAGFAVNDTLTLTGGTFTTAAVLTVTAVNGSGAITNVSVTTGGSYTALPANPLAYTTNGSGTGATINGQFDKGATSLTSAIVPGAGLALLPGWYWPVWAYDGGSSPTLTVGAAGASATQAQVIGDSTISGVFGITTEVPGVSMDFTYTSGTSLPTTYVRKFLNAPKCPRMAINVGV